MSILPRFNDAYSDRVRRPIIRGTYWVPRGLYARMLAMELTPADVSAECLEIKAKSRKWVLVENADGRLERYEPLELVRAYAEVGS